MRALVAERHTDDAVAAYWMGSAYDSTGHEAQVAPHYRRAFVPRLPDELRRPATVQFARPLPTNSTTR
ncbi:tetratricopeptide repeat protein [Embleya sp. MST-111070]|uniref:tetratricopeptide repeat protein n=1 Tax=Embleya sp. MST-111070 TaxID=3398231 RepID=UPI003F73E06F